ncbi:MAG TPA: tol-pal system protein YbgF [Rhizomicrobium sp.]|jgi:tol-pal system protein YbgF
MRMRAMIPLVAAGLSVMAHASAQEQPRHPMQLAALFGESDDEKAARLQHEQNQDQAIATLNQRVNDLENSLRGATGQNEQLEHRIQILNERIDRMQKDFDYKLCTIAAQQLGASAGDAGGGDALPCTAAPSGNSGPMPNPVPQSFSQSGAPASGPPQHLAPGPGVLGTIPSNTALPLPDATANPPAAQMGATPQPVPHPDYDKAMSLMAKTQYDQAFTLFRAFADKHPDDPLAPQALFWAGDIQFVQKDFANASRTLAEGIKKYPASSRAPDSMLKLGESLLAMNQKKEGCTILGAIPTKYPNASKAIATKAVTEHKALCGK